MAVLPILEAPHPLLKVKAEPADPADASLRALARDMLETMYVAPGIGLAAPQVGVLKRLFVVDVADKKKGEEPAPTVLLNPEIAWRSEEEVCTRGGLPQRARPLRRGAAAAGGAYALSGPRG